MAEAQEVINPNFTMVYVPETDGINMVKCNKMEDVYNFIKTGKKYRKNYF